MNRKLFILLIKVNLVIVISLVRAMVSIQGVHFLFFLYEVFILSQSNLLVSVMLRFLDLLLDFLVTIYGIALVKAMVGST